MLNSPMSVAPDSFRQALSRFPSGVTVVTAALADGGNTGVTVSAFCSVSLAPPLILVCLDHATANLDAYVGGEGFCVNVLSDDQTEVSNAFAFPGPVPPFEQVEYSTGRYGAAKIVGALATLECRRDATYPGGDHTIVVGLVEDAAWLEGPEPLIYAGGSYRTLKAGP